jgi:Uncharacterized protein conserved in bacteria
MEKSIEYLREQFNLNKVDIRTYSPLTLAYIGDGIYDLFIRTIIVSEGNCQASKLHNKVSTLVKATKQSEMIKKLKSHLSEEEGYIYKRGRNAKSNSVAKNASTADYRRATGFEAVMGYLYLTNQFERIVDLIKLGLATEDED